MPCVPDLLVFAGGDCRVSAAAHRVSYRPARIFGMADNYSVVAHPVGRVRDLEEIIKVGFSGYASKFSSSFTKQKRTALVAPSVRKVPQLYSPDGE